jgi:hypothetical protein
MDVVLVLLALCAVLLAVRLVRARRRGAAVPDAGWTANDPPGRDADELRPPDARSAVSRNSWMLGGGGSGG